MLSRVADSLYWMSRYLERAENTVRQLDVTMSLLLDSSETSADTRWQRLLTSLGNPEDVKWTEMCIRDSDQQRSKTLIHANSGPGQN